MKFKVTNWSEYVREPDAVDDRGSAVVVASIEALDTRWPAALLRSGDRSRSHARLGVRPATSPDGGFTDIGAEVDGIGSRRPRSHDAEPTSTDIAIGRQPARPWRSDKEARSRSYRRHRAGGLWRWPVAGRKAWCQITSQVAQTASGTGCRQRRDHRSHHADQDTGDAS